MTAASAPAGERRAIIAGASGTARRGDAAREEPGRIIWAAAAAAVLLVLGFRRDNGAPARRGEARHAPPLSRTGIWKRRLSQLKLRVADDRVSAIAAGVTYFSLLSVFPALAALVSLYGLFADPATVDDNLAAAGGVVPGGGMEIIRDQVTRVAAQGGGALGFAFLLGLALSLWSANAATKALFDALNVVYDEKESRGFLKLNAVSLLFTLCGILFLLLAIGAVVVLPAAFSYIGFGGLWEQAAKLARWPMLFLVVALILALVYRFGPDRTNPRWRWITWGSACATVAWLAMSVLFSWYAANFGSFNKTYGSLGAVIGFMTWMWLSAMVVLLGAEIDTQLEREPATRTSR